MVTNTTAETEVVDSGETRDRLGRKITPVSRREELVAAWRQSGLTQAAFARREGVRYPTFASWVQEARKRAVAKPAIKFAQVRVPLAPARVAPAANVEVCLPDGTVVRALRA